MRSTSFATLLLVLMACAGCGASMKRIGYEKPLNPPSEDCAVTFIEVEKNQEVPGKLLGTLKTGHSIFDFNCDEQTIRRLIQKEACKVGADVVVLRDVKEWSLISSCYRVTADLIQSSDTMTINDYTALKKQGPAPPIHRTIYLTLGYSAAAMKKLNSSLEYSEASLRSQGVPADWKTFDDGGIEFGIGYSARFKPTFAFGSDLIYQQLSVDNQYADANLKISDQIETFVFELQSRAEYWPPAVRGFNIGVSLGVPFGKVHKVVSMAQQAPPALSYTDISAWCYGLSYGAFVGYEIPTGSNVMILTRLGYRSRVLSSQLSGVDLLDARGEPVEPDFSGFYFIAGLGLRL